jgi:hypothetical protein
MSMTSQVQPAEADIKLLTSGNFYFEQSVLSRIRSAALTCMVPDRLALLADPSVSAKCLFALRRIAESLENGFLTREEANRAAAHISPACAEVFIHLVSAQHVIVAIETVLEQRYPTRFRARVPRR